MSRVHLADLYRCAVSGDACFPSFDAELSSLTLDTGDDELLILPVEVSEWPNFKAFLEAEEVLERAYGFRNLALRLLPSADMPEPDWKRIRPELQHWILRHAGRSFSFEQRLLSCGQLREIRDNTLYWELPSGIFAFLNQNQHDWLEQFWKKAGFFPLSVVYLAMTESGHERLPQTPPPPIPQPPRVKKAAPAAEEEGKGKSERRFEKAGSEGLLWGRRRRQCPVLPLSELSQDLDCLYADGEVQDLDRRLLKSGNYRVRFLLTQGKSALACIIWAKESEVEKFSELLIGKYVRLGLELSYDERFEQDFVGKVFSIENAVPPALRSDNALEKRVELHIHSKFSTKDACSNPADIVRLAARFGHPAVAITDHGSVQGFPEACQAVRDLAKKGQIIKLIFGMEGYLVDDGPTVFCGASRLYEERCGGLLSFEIERSGDSPAAGRVLSFRGERRTLGSQLELGEAETLFCEIPEGNFSELEPEARSARAEARAAVLQTLSEFMKDTAVISPGGLDDLAYLRYEGFRVPGDDARYKFNPCLIDLPLLAELCGECLPARFSLADPADDAAAGRIRERLEKLALLCRDHDLRSLDALNTLSGRKNNDELRHKTQRSYHIILLANDELGLYHLYRLVSLSNLENFYFRPRIPRSRLHYLSHGLTFGSACVYGEIFSAILALFKRSASSLDAAMETLAGDAELTALARQYDYLEIQPLGNNRFLLLKEDSGVRSEEDLRSLNRLVVQLAAQAGRPVCATCDAHFLEADDEIYREIVMSSMGFDKREDPAPLFFRTTEEMLHEFSYLGESKAREVVVENPQRMAERVKAGMLAFPDGSFPPLIAKAADEVRRLCTENAAARYGKEGQIPVSINQRLEQELTAIISNGYAIMYYIAHELCRQSNDDGYIVGSRGSVGSSLVATFCGISEVNPLPPHYVCPSCHYYEEDQSGVYGSGFDLPAKNCPECGSALLRDGQDIPFATFLGFKGNKQPDIDLNFSGEYQARAHAFIEEMFGTSHTFRAGTIQGYGDKQSQALVREFGQNEERHYGANQAIFLAKGLQGIKVSTGQHPGGIVVVPKEREIYDFTPIQHPADKSDSSIITTHFDFNAMHDTILKIDALGHDDPTMLKLLGDMTGVKILDIPIPDERVMALFASTEAIGIPKEQSTIGSATIGLPEVGTMMAREMIRETHPTRFFDLVQLSGLSHGTNVWKGNAQDLIRDGICTINEVIGCRDSIMTRLIYSGLDPETAFKIMEDVRKGRGLKEEQETAMKEKNVPDWYIESCRKIAYLFPKAHAAAYSISTQRIAYFKVYYPEAFYCAWFTVRGDDFNYDDDVLPAEAIAARRLERRQIFQKLDKAEQKKFYILELVEEMQARGIDFLPLDLDHSEASLFTSPEKGWIRPPLDIVPGISSAIAAQIVEARKEGGAFKNVDELKRRSGIGDAAIDALRERGILMELPESAQMDFFAFGFDGEG